jgi:hypothetical protein
MGELTRTGGAILDEAAAYGAAAADAYWDEFESDADDDPEGVGAWDQSAWDLHWKYLVDLGATATDYDACLDAWRGTFWNRQANRYRPS